jgi:dynein light chain roadblock-type
VKLILGLKGIVVATHEGSVIRSTLDNIQTPQIATLVTQLAAKGKGVVRDLDPEVRALRLLVN